MDEGPRDAYDTAVPRNALFTQKTVSGFSCHSDTKWSWLGYVVKRRDMYLNKQHSGPDLGLFSKLQRHLASDDEDL